MTPGNGRPARFVLPRGGVNFDDVRRELLVQALEQARGNKTATGKLLGLNRDQVRYWMRKFAIPDPVQAEF